MSYDDSKVDLGNKLTIESEAEDEEIAVLVKGVGKRFEIYDSPSDRLKQFIVPRLQINSKKKTYFREFWALRNVSFKVARGETVGIIGRNGSGKSTLLQIICGTLTPTEGEVRTKGRVAALLELGSGFNPEFTGRENVYMSAAILGMQKEQIDTRFNAIAEFADIGEFIDQPVKSYSSGMYVRLAFAVSVHVEPEILVVDEALAVGDIRFQNKCLRKINEIRDAGCSILFVSHNASQVEAFCNRLVWIDSGRIRALGKPAKLIREYTNFMVHGIDKTTSVKSESTSPDTLKTVSVVNETEDWQWREIGLSHNVEKNGVATIEQVRVRFDNDLSPALLLCREYHVEVEAKILFAAAIFNPLIAVGIFNNLNEPVIHFNSASLRGTVDSVEEAGTRIMRFVFDIPALRPGDYLISVGIDDGFPGASNILCHVYDAWTFQVSLSNELPTQAGYIQLLSATAELELETRPVK